MGVQVASDRRELLGVDVAVVHAVDQRPLERQPPTFRREVLLARLPQGEERVALVDRHELVAQRVVRSVQRHREVDGK